MAMEKKLSKKEWEKFDELIEKLGFGGYYDLREMFIEEKDEFKIQHPGGI